MAATSEATEPTTLSSVDDLPAETRRTMAARTSEDMSPETEEMLRWAAASLPDYVADEFSPLTGDPSFAPLLWPVAAPQRDPVLKAVAACGSSLARVPTSERRRRSIVEAAAAQDEEALVYASPKLLGDREFMLSQCIFSGRRLRFASPAVPRRLHRQPADLRPSATIRSLRLGPRRPARAAASHLP